MRTRRAGPPFASIDLGAIAAGQGGFVIRGEAAGDRAGVSVAGVGDYDGDGLDDLLIGAWFSAAGGPQSGAAYVILGKADGAAVRLAPTIASGGFRIDGASADDNLGKSVSGAGDVNGDGVPDLLVGAPSAGGDARNQGESYVVFGGGRGPIDLARPGFGFRIRGETTGDRAGKSNADAGDVNGDGLADLIIGARGDDDGGAQAGAAYVVFGKAGRGDIDLADIAAGRRGFKIVGETADDGAGYTVAGAGDVNGDGTPDLLVGANGQDAGGGGSGAAYVVFGKADRSTVRLTDVATGDGGFKIIGEAAGDRAGVFVSPAGDVNGDGLADVVIGANGNGGRGDPGAAYVVFGRASGAAVDLGAVAAGVDGFKIVGATDGDDAGVAASDAGDVNGDGLGDLLVGARFASRDGVATGAAYLVFGKADGDAVALDDVLLGFGGFALLGAAAGDKAGVAVSAAGDVNGDSLADLIIGADGNAAGLAYVVFGSTDWQ